MMQYGEDFRTGRYNGGGNPYEGQYENGRRAERWWSARRTIGGGGYGSEAAQRGAGDLDESWRSMAHGRGRPDFDGQGYRTRRSMIAERFRGSFPETYGARQVRYDRGFERSGGRVGHDYDEDLAERVRRGWSRIRSEAREWMGGRGYDRAW